MGEARRRGTKAQRVAAARAPHDGAQEPVELVPHLPALVGQLHALPPHAPGVERRELQECDQTVQVLQPAPLYGRPADAPPVHRRQPQRHFGDLGRRRLYHLHLIQARTPEPHACARAMLVND